ncbi:MAG: two-component system phosphate regulon sensor histidine kinase PhoR [Saprospiraceae bacterium]|jgi:two-component system phosphate regulon sensor histidine kinase PhoR
MNKKSIKLIIALMAAALIGIIALQIGWIRSSIRLNEQQFDVSVFNALNKVSERLEYENQLQAYHLINNGYFRAYFTEEYNLRARAGATDFSINTQQGISEVHLSPNDYLSMLEVDSRTAEEGLCNCSKCTAERTQKINSYMNYRTGMDNTPIADRIKLDYIDVALKEELSDRGIDIDYNYGVYSKRKKSYVMANNHYVVEDGNSQITINGYDNLYTSLYRVNLFSKNDSGRSPGLLMVYFPTRSSVVWGTVWLPLLGSILFTGIILFCFAYVINVIFLQKKVSEMRTDFINNMTHEFKTPIATISLAADSISSPMISGKPDKVKRFADIIRQENRRMNAQVEKVLQIAALDKKDFTINRSEINLEDIITYAVQNISLSVEKRGGTVSADLKAKDPIIEGDLTHISNIIINLLDNANKYSPDEPVISVTSRDLRNGMEIVISDKGLGIDKDSVKHIFDKFYRVHTGNVHDVKGFGLGLSYVKAMMDAHGATINVKSEIGKGSSFILKFPRKQTANG